MAAKTEAPAETKPQERAARLPTLPDGWTYQVYAQSAVGGDTVTVTEYGDEATVVEFRVGNETRRQEAANLADGCRALSKGIRALARAAESEAAARQAREEALGLLGAAGDPTPDPAPDPFATAADPWTDASQ
jgi:hypothetical protein